jgi:tRNA pseudouridine38-40 synthase
MGPSIEGTLRTAIEKIQQHPVSLDAASRTDAGVHADAQLVTFSTPQLRKDPASFLLSLNCLLPPSIRVLDVVEEADDFHPSLSAEGKIYHYWLANGVVLPPKWRWTTWHTPGALDLALMHEAARLLIGTHNFAAFCNELSNTHFSDTYRTLTAINISQYEDNRLCIHISGTNFLYKMVRNIVGTLVYIGRRRLSIEMLHRLLENGIRAEAGVTAPAQGLTLHKVLYS